MMGREIPDTIFHTVPSLNGINYDDSPAVFLGSDSVITVAHLFYSSDSGLSQQLIKDVASLSERFSSNQHIEFFSLSVDSLDTPSKLREFLTDAYMSVNPRWRVMRPSGTDMLAFARKSLLVEARASQYTNQPYILSNQLVLIDSEHRIRGFYDISLRSEIERLEDEIKLQLVEEIRNRPLKVERK